jgi:BirA family biotin operon repressor/biotin-[acetyl-CoA-carboxylase] ligase
MKAEYGHADLPDRVVYPYSLLCSTLGRRVRAERSGGEAIEGVATGLDESGGLIVDTSDGTRTLSFGEVTHLRAAQQ